MRQTTDLGGTTWQFGPVPRCPFDAPNVDDRTEVTDWLPATVPGNVRSDLLALGRIPDPFFGDGYRASLWVEDRDWWYRRWLDVLVGADQRAFLVFDGIDYLSAVFINGHELGRHEGMFSRQVYEITRALRADTGAEAILQASPARRTMEIAVRLWGSGALPRRRLNPLERAWGWLADRMDPTDTGAFPNRMATVKCQMSFGWDFAAPIRTMGLWDDVWLAVTGRVFIQDVYVKPGIPGAKSQTARLTAQVTVDSDQSRSVQAEVQVHPSNFDGPGWGPVFFDLDLPLGRSVHNLTFDLPHPQLWEPWDRGFPHLYEFAISLHLSSSPSQPLDTVSTRFGIRHIALEDWTFTLNGSREFIRGANWVPADSMPGRLRRDDYVELLPMARTAGVNLLRVWGGGLREKRAFYDLCDELGLLVWQEFPFACSFLGYFPRDARWLGLVKRECSAIVQATRNHPSLAVWCGGNEFSPGRNRPLVRTLARVVEVEDGTRPFLPVSPSPGDAHNWDVWHGKYPIHAYRQEKARFLSEFGLQAPPSGETLRTCLPEAELWPPGSGWEVHKAEWGKLWRYVDRTLTPALSLTGRGSGREGEASCTPSPSQGEGWGEGEASLEEFIIASQRAQALGLQIAIEHMRQRKGETGGVCLWQFNEPWPAVSWAIVDYRRQPKLAYRWLKDLYNLVLVGLTFPPVRYQAGDMLQAQVWAVNDSLELLDGCRLVIELEGVKIYEIQVTLPPDSAQVIGALRHQFLSEPGDLRLALCQGERVIARNTYDLTYYDPTSAGRRERLVRWLADVMLR
jgi:beta-mannosidase